MGILKSGATEDHKLYTGTAWVLSLRYSGKCASLRDLKVSLRTESFRLLAMSSQLSKWWGDEGGLKWGARIKYLLLKREDLVESGRGLFEKGGGGLIEDLR